MKYKPHINCLSAKVNSGRRKFSNMHLIMSIALFGIISFVFAQTVTYKIYLIGDSTVCYYAPATEYPWAGWGQELSYFFKSGTVTIDNKAIGGRSTKLFYKEGRWATVVSSLKSGDFVLIQFGHNDRDYSKEERYADTTTYKEYLRLYVKESRAKGAIPVFISPMNMNTWNGTALREVFTERDKGADYRGAMMNIAAELSVPFIDLEKKSAAFMKTAGQAYCTNYHFMGLQTGEYPLYPDGYSDGTHFQEMGAIINARMVAEGIKELSTHADVGKLAAVLAPLNKVTVAVNKASTGLVTLSGEFPEKAAVTLKVMPNSTETFQNWADAAGKSVSTSKYYTFTMGSTPVTFTAMFKGGSTATANDYDHFQNRLSLRNNQRYPVRLTITNNALRINAQSAITAVEIFDLNGKLLQKQCFSQRDAFINLKNRGCGVYFVKTWTSDNVSVNEIELP